MKSHFLKLFSQRGFTLPEIMIGTAILAGVSLAGVSLFRNQSKAQSQVTNDTMLNSFHGSIAKFLNNAHNCNATLRHRYNSTIGPADDLTNIKICTSGCNLGSDAQNAVGSAFYSEGDWIDKNLSRQIWSISSISYGNMGAALNKTDSFPLRITYTLNPKLGTRTIAKDIILNARFDAAGRFKECFNDQESAVNNLQNDVCKSFSPLGSNGITSDGVVMVWNEATQTCDPYGTTANPLKDCTTHGLMVEGMRADGSMHCRPIGQGFDPEPIRDTSQTTCGAGTQARVEFVGGKVKVTCF